MSALVTSAMAWCDGFTLPLVVPLTDWLQPPLPHQSRCMSTPGVRLVESTPSGQHILCVADTDPQLWHIMSNQLVHTFKGFCIVTFERVVSSDVNLVSIRYFATNASMDPK